MAAPQAMKAAVPDVAADPSAALALVLDAQRKVQWRGCDGCTRATLPAFHLPPAPPLLAAARRQTRASVLPLLHSCSCFAMQLGQLDAVTKGLVDDLVTSAGQGPRLRELLATGEDLLAAVEAAANRLGATLPEGASLPPGPSQSVTGEPTLGILYL